MKKIILMLLMLPLSVFSQDTTITGMMGIPFGISKQEVISKMKLKGYTNEPNQNEYLSFEQVKFGAFKSASVNYYFTENKFYQGLVVLLPDLDAKTVALYNDVIEEISKKYGPGESYKKFKSPYKDGDGFELTAIKTGNADYQTFWANRKQGIISAYISETLIVVIKYQDKALTKEAVESQSSKNASDY
jgi:hypothetical protein